MSKSRNPPRSRGPAGHAARRAVILCDRGHETEVLNSRGVDSGDVIRRQRACQCCPVFTTYESRMNPASEGKAIAALVRFEQAVEAAKKAIATLARDE